MLKTLTGIPKLPKFASHWPTLLKLLKARRRRSFILKSDNAKQKMGSTVIEVDNLKSQWEISKSFAAEVQGQKVQGNIHFEDFKKLFEAWFSLLFPCLLPN